MRDNYMNVYDKGLITILACNAVFILVSIPLILRRVPRNPVYGYRTRAALSDDRIWYEANACFGWRFLVGGVFSAGAALLIYAWPGMLPDTYLKITIALLAAPGVVAWLLTVWRIRSMNAGNRLSNGPH